MHEKPVMIITGTRTSIGRLLAEHYVTQGFQVIGCSRHEIDFDLENYNHFFLDVSDELSVKKMFSEIRKTYGRLDILINNASVASSNYVFLTSIKEVNNALSTNVAGSILFCREAIKLMKNNNFGRIINMSSIQVPLASEGTSLYGATKAAVEQFSKVLSREVFSFGISVNTLSLSAVENTSMEKDLTKEARKKLLDQTVSKSLISISDVTNALDFFMSTKSKVVTNQVLYLGGI